MKTGQNRENFDKRTTVNNLFGHGKGFDSTGDSFEKLEYLSQNIGGKLSSNHEHFGKL